MCFQVYCPRGGEKIFTANIYYLRRAHSERTDTSRVVLSSVPYGSGLLGSMGDEALGSLSFASEHQLSSADPVDWKIDILHLRLPFRRCELDVHYCSSRTHDRLCRWL